MTFSYAHILTFAVGVVFGSFLNVMIYRLPRRESLVFPASHCPACHRDLRWFHNIPIVSYLLLRGRCAYCTAPIPVQYPLVEFLGGAAVTFWLVQCGLTWVGLKFVLLSFLLIVLSWIDGRHRMVPDRLILFSLPFALAIQALQGWQPLVSGLVGAVFGGAALLMIWWLGHLLFRRDAIGGGDIKLAALLGLLLGWQFLLISLFLTFCLIALVGWTGILLRRIDKNTPIPMVPFLSIGVFLSIFIGYPLIQWYVHLLHHAH